jgi:hypothetical protein
MLNFIVKTVMWQKVSSTLNQGNIYRFLWLFDFLHPWFLLWAYLTNKIGSKNNKWK